MIGPDQPIAARQHTKKKSRVRGAAHMNDNPATTRQKPPPDSGRRRYANAARVDRVARSRWWNAPRLWLHTIPMPACTDLYDPDTARSARALVAQLFGGALVRWKVERGARGGIHLHAIAPLATAAGGAPPESDVRGVWDLRGILTYLEKPADARLARPGPRGWHLDHTTRRRAAWAALDERGAAIAARRAVGKARLAPLCGWSGRTPRPTSALVALRLVLVARALRRAALLSLRRRPGGPWWPCALRPGAVPRPAPRARPGGAPKPDPAPPDRRRPDRST